MVHNLEMVGPELQRVLIIHGIWSCDLCSNKWLDLYQGKSIWGDLISNSFHAVKHSNSRVSDGII